MSGFLANKALLSPTVTRYSGGTASFTLPQSGSTNSTQVLVGGVEQVPGVDFTVSGTGLSLTTSAPAGANMVCARQYFSDGITGTSGANTVATAAVQDNAINLAKMAGGTDGQIITYDASGDPVAVGPGTDGQVLTSTGAGSPPAFEDAAGGAWAVKAAASFQDVTSITWTLNSTKAQRIHIVGLKSYTSGGTTAGSASLGLQTATDATSFNTGSSDYYTTHWEVINGSTHRGGNLTSSNINLVAQSLYGGDDGINGELIISIPRPQPDTGTSQRPAVFCEFYSIGTSGNTHWMSTCCGSRVTNENIHTLKLNVITSNIDITGSYVHLELN